MSVILERKVTSQLNNFIYKATDSFKQSIK